MSTARAQSRASRTATLAALALSIAMPASAFCLLRDKAKPDGWDWDHSVGVRTFPVEDEFARAFLIATVKVMAARQLFEDKNDPEGLTAHTYRVQPIDTLKGPVLPEFTLFNGNTTARFDMDVGKTYLVFVLGAKDSSVVDNCGWSDELSKAADTLAKVKTLAATSRPPATP